MFTSTPTYSPASHSLSSSVPQLPTTIIFNSGVPSYLPGNSGPFLSQSHLSGYLSHGLQSHDHVSQGADLNSPGVFRQNLSIALSEVDKLQMIARTVLSDIQNAYQPGIAPHLTQAHIERLQEQLFVTIQTLTQSGVGALPLLPIPTSATPISVLPQISSEEDLLSNITKGLQILYDNVQKSQENANVVGNLLGFEKDKEIPSSSSITSDSFKRG